MKHATIIKACWLYMPFLNVLSLTWWKNEERPEREAFSDEDSDEKDSDHEEVVNPKKKQAKRKCGANEAASSKRIKPNPKSHICISKPSVPPTMLNKQAPKSSLGYQWIHQNRLLMRLHSDSNRINPSSHPSLLEDNSRGDQLYNYYCDYVTFKIQCKYPDFNFSNVFCRISKQKFSWWKSFLSSKKATQALSVQ